MMESAPTQLTVNDSVGMSAWERIAEANRIAMRHAMDADIRKLAKHITRNCSNIPRQAPTKIARWIRRNIVYLMEAPNVEILQGPHTTLWSGAADCDCLVILWSSICRSIGIRSYCCGVAEIQTPETFTHSIGYDADSGQHYELTDDRRYIGGFRAPPIRWTTPPGYGTVFSSNEPYGGAGYWIRGDSGTYRQTTEGANEKESQMIMGRSGSTGSPQVFTMLGRYGNPDKKPGMTPPEGGGGGGGGGGGDERDYGSDIFDWVADLGGDLIRDELMEPDVYDERIDAQMTAQGYEVYEEPTGIWGEVPVALWVAGGVAVVAGIFYFASRPSK